MLSEMMQPRASHATISENIKNIFNVQVDINAQPEKLAEMRDLALNRMNYIKENEGFNSYDSNPEYVKYALIYNMITDYMK